MSKYVRITQARRRKIDGKRWALDSFTITNSRSGFPTSRILTNGISTYWMLRDGYAERDSQGRYVIGIGQKYRELKEMRQKEKPVVNLVTPVAQALEIAKSDLKRKREDTITDGGRKTATSDWNSLRY